METILSTCDVPTIKQKTRVLGKKCPFSNKLENQSRAILITYVILLRYS